MEIPFKTGLLKIPAIRSLWEARNALLAQRDALSSELDACQNQLAAQSQSTASPFYYYHSCFDAQALICRHAVSGLQPHSQYLTNFLGVLIDPEFFPSILTGRAGQIEPVPIPANWHADMSEWAAALRAVDLASDTFTMIELGCGWGCWMNNTGVAARRTRRAVQLIGIEGDKGHLGFAREACEANGFRLSEITLHHGVAAAKSGTALFPHQGKAGSSWGLEPIFGATKAQLEHALRSGRYDALPMIPLGDVAAHYARIDLLHVDIQGGEADLITDSLPLLCQKFAYLLIGTHSRTIEGKLFEVLLGAGWRLEIERPCRFQLIEGMPSTYVDGVQGWRNPALLPQQDKAGRPRKFP